MLFHRHQYYRHGETFGALRYASIMGASVSGEDERSGIRKEAKLIYDFKRVGMHSRKVRLMIEAAAAYFECDQVVAVPGHEAGSVNSLQNLFGQTIVRTADVTQRKYQHKGIPEGYADSYEVREITGRKILLVDDVATTGSTLRHFTERLRALGFEVQPCVLGLNVKLQPEPAFVLVLPDPEAMGLQAAAGELLSLSEFGRLCDPPMTRQGVSKAIEAGRLEAVEVDGERRIPSEALKPFNEARNGGDGDGDKIAWSKEKTKAEALLAEERRRKLELERLELEGKLHRVEDIEAVWSEIVTAARAKMLSLPTDVAADLGAKLKRNRLDVQEIVEAAVYRALTELATDTTPMIREHRRRRLNKFKQVVVPDT